MVEGGGLENRKARKGLGGSNPSSSATNVLQLIDKKAVRTCANMREAIVGLRTAIRSLGPSSAPFSSG